MKKKVRIVIGLFIIAGLAGVAYRWQLSRQSVLAETGLQLYGNVDIREAHLAFNASEHVATLLVNEGDRVQAGQLLAQLHTERLQAALDKARADVAAMTAEAYAATLSNKRIKTLARQKLASAEEAEVAEARSRAATAHVVAAEAMVAVAAQALKDANLYAPTDGIIRDRLVEAGDFVTPQSPVLTLALANPVWVRTYLPETFLGKVKPGMTALISTDSFPGKHYAGWIGTISPTAEFTPKSVETPELRTRLVYQLRVYVCNPELELRLGMPATVTIDLSAAPVDSAADHTCTHSGSKTGR